MTCCKYLGKFMDRILKDLKQKELLPVKILFFVHMSTILVLYPYLTIHMRELGINIEETAIMSAVTPVVGILMPPLAGMLADKIGNFKVMLALFSVFSGLSALLLLLVPVGRVTIIFPENILVGVPCNGDTLSLFEDFHCDKSNSTNAELFIESCGYVCQSYNNEETSLKSNFHKLKDLNYYAYNTTENDYQRDIIRKLSENYFYFPITEDNYCNIKSFDYTSNYSLVLRNNNNELYNNNNNNELIYDYNKLMDMQNNVEKNVNYQMNRRNVTHNMLLVNYTNNLSQYKGENKSEMSMTNNTLTLDNCSNMCLATSPRKNFCSNKKLQIPLDIKVTFWSYLAVRVFIGIIGGTAYTMFEGAVIAILREYKADYGLQRMYASFGGMISSPLSGLLIDYASQGKKYTDYRPVFFLYAALKVISAVLMLFINLEFKTPAKSVVADVLSLMNIELISLFVAVFLLGSAWGYIESFLFWLLQDLGGSKYLMGLTITVGGILGIPLLALSGPIIKKFGHANIIFIGFIAYAIRLFGYSIIYNPWLSLIFEAMECLTHSLCFTAAITYAARLSTVTTDTTIQGILGGLFYGVGKSAGSLVGGYLIKYIGMRGTFQLFASVTGVTAFIYLAFFQFYMKKRSRLTPEVKEKDSDKIENGMKDLTLAKQIEEIVEKPKSIPYEDTLTNLGYEDTENDLTDEQNVVNNTK